MESDKTVVQETSAGRHNKECIKAESLVKRSRKILLGNGNDLEDAQDKGDNNIFNCTNIENLEIGPYSPFEEDVVEWDDPDLLSALQSLTTKDEKEERNHEEKFGDNDETDSISKHDSIPSIDIDPVEIHNCDIDTSFLKMFDFDNNDVNMLASIQPTRNIADNATLNCVPCTTGVGQNINKFVQTDEQKENIRRHQQHQQYLHQQYLQQIEERMNERNRVNKSNPLLLNNFKKNERICFGHKETIFGLAFSPSGKLIATASQDATIGIWSAEKHLKIATLCADHKKFECLRVSWISETKLASAGADGKAKIWEYNNELSVSKWNCVHTLDHDKPKDPDQNNGEKDKETTAPQIYALQYIEKWHLSPSFVKENILLTSTDDYIHLWQMESESIKRIMDINFTDLDQGFGGVFIHFLSTHSDISDCNDNYYESKNFVFPTVSYNKKVCGGHRNLENLVFVFEASYCAANKLLGVALSDGTLRLVNGRGVCVSILQLPGCESYLTSFAWDKSGQRLASCVATGHLILWEIETLQNEVLPSCMAVLEGGHMRGRPLYGAKYCGDKEEFILTWGVDGKICLWDSHSDDQINEPIDTLVSHSDYPIYAVDTSALKPSQEQNNKNDKNDVLYSIAVAGGRENGFVGVPFYLYDVVKTDQNL